MDQSSLYAASATKFIAIVAPVLLCLVILAIPFDARGGAGKVIQPQGNSGVPDSPTVPEAVARSSEVLVLEATAATPVEVLPEPEPAVAESAAPDPCADALNWVAAAGLPLPAGVGYHCPSTQFAHQGAACWNGSPCRGSGFIAINMDLLAGTSTAYLRHVVAHEVCHILDFQEIGDTTEAGADACAAAHGASG